ncbi:hypothetical protein Tco_0348715 [Tanacetum coccineum]
MRGEDRLSNLPLSIIERILCLVPIQGQVSCLRNGDPTIPVCDNRLLKTKIDKGALKVLIEILNGCRKRESLDLTIEAVCLTNVEVISLVGELQKQDGKRIKMLTRCLKRVVFLGVEQDSSKKVALGGMFRAHASALETMGFSWEDENSYHEKTLLRFLSSCPLLKTVILNIHWAYIARSNDGSTFMELLECLPVIETLSLLFEGRTFINMFEDRVKGRVPRELPTPSFHLKYLYINYVGFTPEEELILALLIKSSPNLEKLKILDSSAPYISFSRVECYLGIMLEHLNELEIKDFMDLKTRFDFVKLILARSPVLKKVRIFPHYYFRDKRLQISEILLGYSRASPEMQVMARITMLRQQIAYMETNKIFGLNRHLLLA